ncbi:class I SAM-dependent methyltransferase [Salsuginibacillus kocurii]|uniref:class I SAM-dependent methyltransferase n=1 Tax=Salsuginibacillus kocurii TaxID=427078 RepID=UPI00036290FE|nr:class I SAM-dependent methyltransferase [Salsuginibacillus kocurii]
MSNEEVKKAFGAAADDYVKSELHAKGEDLQALLEAIQPAAGKEEVLDVATGAGHVVHTVAPHVKRVTATDMTPEMLETAQAFVASKGHTNVTFTEAAAESLPFALEQFDLVITRLAAHHFAATEAFIKEAWRVLKPGGRLYVLDNVAPEDEDLDHFYNKIEKWRDPSHNRAFKKTEWMQLIEAHSFNVEQVRSFSKRFTFNDWCDRMKVPAAEQEKLSSYMLSQDERFQQAFSIDQALDGSVESFSGQSILLQAQKQPS